MSEEWTGDDTAYRPGGLPQPDLAKVGEVGVWGEDLRARPAQPEPEPVAQVQVAEDYHAHVIWTEGVNPVDLDQKFLYTAPPQREWQGLTDEEIKTMWDNHIIPVFNKHGISPFVFARAIEAKLKEKNEWTCKN
jgi:hypothetical protein